MAEMECEKHTTHMGICKTHETSGTCITHSMLSCKLKLPNLEQEEVEWRAYPGVLADML